MATHSGLSLVDLPNLIPCAALLGSQDSTADNCPQQAAKVCGVCKLVAYCSRNCQENHWSKHKGVCKKSVLASKTWRPRWCSQDREPAFIGSSDQAMDYLNASGSAAETKYLLGNTPTIDLLKLGDNEGTFYGKDIKLCYAASGDLRNAMRTIAALPPTYPGSIGILLNDREICVVLRNILFVLLLTAADKSAAIDAVIHYWYSATLTSTHVALFRSIVLPFFQDVCGKIAGKPASSIQSKRIQIGNGSLRVILTRGQWDLILKFLTRSVDTKACLQSRRHVCLSRGDHLDRHLLCFETRRHCRVAKVRFREEGILLPFGRSTSAFDQINPTLFSDSNKWFLNDSSDPLDGFGYQDVDEHARMNQGGVLPQNDIYGRLYSYLSSQLSIMYDRIRDGVNIEMLAQDARKIASICSESGPFDRIDTSNIVDLPYLGVPTTLSALKPLLNAANPHAAIISLFMNAVKEQDYRTEHVHSAKAAKEAMSYLPPPASPPLMGRPTSNPFLIKVMMATELFCDRDALWEGYVAAERIREKAAAAGMKARGQNCIVAAWPYGLRKKTPKDPGLEEEIEQILTSGISGLERYVEWVPL